MKNKRFLQKFIPITIGVAIFVYTAFPFISEKLTKNIVATTPKIQTGYYVGNGKDLSITGLGFKPDFLIIKSNAAINIAAFKTSAMPEDTTAFFSGLENRDNRLILEDDGFTVREEDQLKLKTDGFSVSSSANLNVEGIRYIWIAFQGSDCTTTGSFCVGTYQGEISSSKDINTGFTPDLVIVKSNANTTANFATSLMNSTQSLSFSNVGIYTNSAYTSIITGGFRAGSTNSTVGQNFYYVAFKASSEFLKIGTYIGDSSDDRNIFIESSFNPDFVIVKSHGANHSVMNTKESYGDSSSYIAINSANIVDAIQNLNNDGFQIGTNAVVNSSSTTYHYIAFRGITPFSTPIGTFRYQSGTYSGNGNNQKITGLTFSPDLIIIKRVGNQNTVFSTSLMPENSTAYLASATANFAGGITSFTADGFTIGNHPTVNTTESIYHWQAFGNAYNPNTNSGSADFVIGAYYGSGLTRDITRIPFQPDMVTIKSITNAAGGTWKPSSITDQNSLYFAGSAQGTNIINSLNSNGFSIGTSAVSNSVGVMYYWFGFKEGSNFDVGTYTGDGNDNREITGLGFDPDLVWIKRTTNVNGVFKPSTITGVNSFIFGATADNANAIKELITDGFKLGNDAIVNAATGIYHYAAWKEPTHTPPTGLPGIPGTPSISNITLTTLTINWSHASNATSYRIERAYDIDGFPGPYRKIAETTNNTYNDTELGPSNTYWYRVRAINSNGNGLYSQEVTATLQKQPLSIQTGYYIGNGGSVDISGIGFSPEFVIIKSTSTASAGVFKSISQPKGNHSFFGATADNSVVNLNSEGVMYIWIAFAGSDCSEGGEMCIGRYYGTGSSTKDIVTGFQPDVVIVKNNINTAAHFSTSSMNTGESLLFSNTAINTSGTYINKFNTDGFRAGSTNNSVGITFYYIAFKQNNSFVRHGSYIGNGIDDRDIVIAENFKPDFIIVKSLTNIHPNILISKSYGDNASYIGTSSANVTNSIQKINPNGFQIGTQSMVNTNGTNYHYLAFAGAQQPQAGGNFKMATGSYIGNGEFLNISNIGFKPDLVIIKNSSNQYGVYKTSTMGGDSTAYFSAAVTNIQGAIISLNEDGFTLGNNTTVNVSGSTYHWQAFGNAYNPYTNTGSTKFAIGAIYGNGIVNRIIDDLPFQPNLVAIKRLGASAGAFKVSTLTGDSTFYYTNSAPVSGLITSLEINGFVLGSDAVVNSSGNIYHWFAFAEGTHLELGTYTGNNLDNREFTGLSFKPDLVWIKSNTTTDMVQKSNTISGSWTQYLRNTADINGGIKELIDNGFKLDNNPLVNASSNIYHYVSWKIPLSVVSISISDGEIHYGILPLDSSKNTIDLGDSQRVTNTSSQNINLNIKGTNATGGGCTWTLSSNTGNDEYSYQFCNSTDNNCSSPPINYTYLSTSYQLLKGNLSPGNFIDFHLKLNMPVNSTCFGEQTTQVTIQASEI